MHCFFKDVGLRTSFKDKSDTDASLWLTLFEGVIVPYSYSAQLFRTNIDEMLLEEKKIVEE
jgi:hypothetical protein